MKRIIVFANQKGGVGKTTCAVNLAASYAEINKNTLIIDLDPQGNATTGLGIDKRKLLSSTYELLVTKEFVEPVDTGIENLKIICSHPDLAGAEVELVDDTDRNLKLRKKLEYYNNFDVIIIDTPPSLGILTINGLSAARDLIITMQAEFYALEGLSMIINTYERIKSRLNPELNLLGILVNMFMQRLVVSNEVLNDLKMHFKNKVFNALIPRSVRVVESQSFGKPMIIFDPKSVVSSAFRDLLQEIEKNV
ncbi:MAG TPA: ParA family protein [Thermodesulfobium narugense]|uniref:Chromosome segregation ATPase n=1 Tax=Thermodesulfobium acidiphilum TaxID=1794699 RepID=A0A2R4W2W8_THEAF|nr:ParA family protein [Thermodesulfobium acidiphilum]AWB11123.1 chromosome segregation ATPase [Thermodesulfobium acidiphilum]PMP85595.1 MAG: sporulation initiation inhibitor Soj [Thermodesulfobium narugense]HEM55615.1 ParA family protein [Thermodesulfobium narugense]